jgi:hypothetical protein
MNKRLCVVLLIVITSITFSQQFIIKGKVLDRINHSVLSYSSIRISGSSSGTAANYEGNFELRLNRGIYVLIASFIGYKSDTISVDLNANKTITFNLEPTGVRLGEITVLPNENPALEIIRRTIKAKHERNDKLKSYIAHAYTKGTIRTTNDFSPRGNNASLSLNFEKDTSKLKITGIIENESIGYYEKPDKYKDEIIARKQSKNTPASVNTLTGGRIIQNFYSDDIQFFNRPLPSPISDDALIYYDYNLEKTLASDNRNIFQIHVEPIKKTDPGFEGTIYIADSIFSLVKIDVNLNATANPGRIFNKVNILQQYSKYENNIFMPVDYRVFADGNALGIFKFGLELNTIFYDYKVNTPIPEDIFNMAIVKVLPDADKKDSLYWKSTQTIPSTLEEQKAYTRIDSLESLPKSFWDNFHLLSTSVPINDNISITGPLSLYSFNRVEGNALNFGCDIYQAFDKRLNSGLEFSYGFSDKRFKSDFSSSYYIGEYRTSVLSVTVFDKLTDLFGESIHYNKLTSTLTNLFGKYDFRDYYYTKGFSAAFNVELFPVFNIGAGVLNRTDNDGLVNSNFSLLNTSKTYNSNKSIYETKINAITMNFQLDFRKYIEDGYFRRRVSQREFSVSLSGDAIYSSDELGSNLNFQLYKLTLRCFVPTFRSAFMNLKLNQIYSDGPVPFQMLYSLPGNIDGVSQYATMHTLNTGEFYGDRVTAFSMEHFFNDELFRFFGLNFLIDWQFNLSAHFNAAIVEISPDSKAIITQPFSEFKTPFAEIGFGIGQALIPLRLEFTWKLNYFGTRNFVIGISSALL